MPLYRRREPNMQLMEYKCVEFAEELMYGHLRKKTPRARMTGRRSSPRMMLRYEVWLGVLAFASLTQVSAAQSAERAILQSVQTAVQGDLTIVTIAADGPLPQPLSGEPDAPPRIFFDFTGVTPKAWEKIPRCRAAARQASARGPALDRS